MSEALAIKNPPVADPLAILWEQYFAGQHDEAIKGADAALHDGLAADYLHVSGLSLLSIKQTVPGLRRLKASLALHPENPHWAANASIMALAAKANKDAIAFAKSGLEHNPNDKVLLFAHGNGLMADFQFEAARDAFLAALAIDPDMIDSRLNYGNCLHRMGDTPGAMACYNQVLAQSPGHMGATINRAGLYLELGMDGDAHTSLVELASELPEVAFMLALVRLTDGDFTEGWKLYRARWKCVMSDEDRGQLRRPMPDRLSDLRGKHVLLFHEQGFGDSLQFIRYVPMLTRYAGKVSVIVPKPLVRLFQQIDPFVKVVSNRDRIEPYDYDLPMLDAPFLFNTQEATIPAAPYLRVTPEALRERALPPCPGCKRIGLCWAGERRPDPDLAIVDARRSMQFEQFEPIFDAAPEAKFVSLMFPGKSPAADSASWLEKPLRPDFDFMDSAAIIAQLDLVITVDTSIAHLAGGLGVPVWVLSRYDGCWRWLRERSDSPWYPKVLQLFRQLSPGAWPMDDLVADLKAFMAAP